MLGPALQHLLNELDKFKPEQRSDFENQLHRELTAVSQSLDNVRRIDLRGIAATAVGALAAVRTSVDTLHAFSLEVDLGSGGLGSGDVDTVTNTKCSKADCPNKRAT